MQRTKRSQLKKAQEPFAHCLPCRLPINSLVYSSHFLFVKIFNNINIFIYSNLVIFPSKISPLLSSFDYAITVNDLILIHPVIKQCG